MKLAWLRSFSLHQLKYWVNGAFMAANHFPRLYLNQSRDYHELKSVHSMKLAWLRSFFLHLFKFWVMDAFLSAIHFLRLHLNQGVD
jgi:hypothetical protein